MPDPIHEYLAHVITDGDWSNDWLTHIPPIARPVVEQFGMLIAYSQNYNALEKSVCMGVEYGAPYSAFQDVLYPILQWFNLIALICQ